MECFNNKVVVVTGASQGLGFHTAKAFLERGAKVIMIARTADKLQAAVDSMNSPNAIPFPMDISVEADWQRLVAYVKETFGEMDVLVNNAAIVPGIDILHMDFDMFKNVCAINMDSVFLGMKYCYEVLKKGVYSSIINISSVGGLKGGPGGSGDAGYNASKAAVRNLTKHASYVFAPDRIRVVSVHPSGINTPMREEYIKNHPEAVAAGALRNPLPPHCTQPEDLAEIVVFLSTSPAKTITGSEVLVDCGQMAI